MEFQKLLEIIKKYKDGGEDYFFVKHEKGNSNTGETYEEKDEFTINSPQLKKEARKLIFSGDTEDGGYCKAGMTLGEKWYHYEKGDGTKSDKFSVENISKQIKEQKKRDREQAQRDREQAERDRRQTEQDKKEAERRKKEKENSPETFDNKKKCAGCHKELDPNEKTEISMGPVGSKKGRIYFCPDSLDECQKKYFGEKDQQRKNKPDNNNPLWEEKRGNCAECGKVANWENDWQYFTDSSNKIYCGECMKNKRHETESEIKKVQDQLQNLKSKLENSSNPTEIENLKWEIENTESHLKDLKNKKNNPSQSNSSKDNYGKLFLAGAVIFSVVILVSILIARTHKRKIKRKN